MHLSTGSGYDAFHVGLHVGPLSAASPIAAFIILALSTGRLATLYLDPAIIISSLNVICLKSNVMNKQVRKIITPGICMLSIEYFIGLP